MFLIKQITHFLDKNDRNSNLEIFIYYIQYESHPLVPILTVSFPSVLPINDFTLNQYCNIEAYVLNDLKIT